MSRATSRAVNPLDAVPTRQVGKSITRKHRAHIKAVDFGRSRPLGPGRSKASQSILAA